MFSRSASEEPIVDKDNKGYKNWLVKETNQTEEGRLYVKIHRRMQTFDKLDVILSRHNSTVPIIWGAHHSGLDHFHKELALNISKK